jgi:toxin FitB
VNVVDSSAWIEYFTEGPNADYFAAPIEQIGSLVVPSLCIFEVYKWTLRERDESQALKAVAQMQQGEIVALDSKLAVFAARLGLESKLPMADSVVLATARFHEATLWTQDSDFENIPEVKFKAKVKK